MAADQVTYPVGFCVSLYQPIESSCDGAVDLGDKRRQASFDWLSERMARKRSCSIHQLSDSETERKRAQRLLNNQHITCSDFLGSCCLASGTYRGQDLVNVCDQTELHFSSCVGRLSEDLDHLGVVGNGMQFGQNAVVGLVLDGQARSIHGLSSISFHSRSMEQTSSRQRQKIAQIGRDERPLIYRESHKWVRSVEQCAMRFAQARRITHIIDREADDANFYLQLYQQDRLLQQVPTRHDLLIRLKTNRWVIPHQASALGMVASSNAVRLRDPGIEKRFAGQLVLDISADRRCSVSFERDADYQYHRRVEWKTKRVARQALVEVHYFQAKMDAAQTLQSKCDMPVTMRNELAAQSTWFDQLLTFVEVREVASYDPHTGQAIDLPAHQRISWNLMTTRSVKTPEESLQVVALYARRFASIEQLFRLLKKKGFNVEATQQRTTSTIIKTVAMAVKASALALRLVQVRDQSEGHPIEDFFDPRQIEVLELANLRYQGKTNVQQNPFPAQQAAWAAWIIARMGGWKPENKQRPPGPISMQRGLERFNDFFIGVAMVKQWDIDVSPP